MAYIEKLQGYVTDVPEIWLNRQDGRKFHFDKLSSSNVSPENNFTEVNGGWHSLLFCAAMHIKYFSKR